MTDGMNEALAVVLALATWQLVGMLVWAWLSPWIRRGQGRSWLLEW